MASKSSLHRNGSSSHAQQQSMSNMQRMRSQGSGFNRENSAVMSSGKKQRSSSGFGIP
jgi:hypothetical protein